MRIQKAGLSHNPPVPSSSIHALPLEDLHVEAAARLNYEVFLADEPSSRCQALDLEWFYPNACFYVQALVNKGLSFLARDECSGKITGFIFYFDMVDDLEQEGAKMKEFLMHFRQECSYMLLPTVQPLYQNIPLRSAVFLKGVIIPTNRSAWTTYVFSQGLKVGSS